MGPVVEPGQEAEEEERKDGYDELEDGDDWLPVHLVTLQHFHQQAGQDTKLGSWRSRLHKAQTCDSLHLYCLMAFSSPTTERERERERQRESGAWGGGGGGVQACTSFSIQERSVKARLKY